MCRKDVPHFQKSLCHVCVFLHAKCQTGIANREFRPYLTANVFCRMRTQISRTVAVYREILKTNCSGLCGRCSTFVVRHCVSLPAHAGILTLRLSKQTSMKAQTDIKIDPTVGGTTFAVAKPRANNVLDFIRLDAALPKESNVIWIASTCQGLDGVRFVAKLRRRVIWFAGSIGRRAAIGTVRAVKN